MKHMSCNTMTEGKTACDFDFAADTPEGMMDVAMAHAKEAHPEIAAKWGAATEEEFNAWKGPFVENFPNLPDAA